MLKTSYLLSEREREKKETFTYCSITGYGPRSVTLYKWNTLSLKHMHPDFFSLLFFFLSWCHAFFLQETTNTNSKCSHSNSDSSEARDTNSLPASLWFKWWYIFHLWSRHGHLHCLQTKWWRICTTVIWRKINRNKLITA